MAIHDVPGIETTDERLSDAALVAAVAGVVRRPRVEIADSFVLHAPLELAARSALLPLVRPSARIAARARIAAIAGEYAAFGVAVPPPRSVTFESTAEGAIALGDAIAAGELDTVDAVAAELGRTAAGADLPALLTDALLPRLSAAAHAPIFLYQMARVAPGGELTAELVRPLARELARFPDWSLGWLDRGPAVSAVLPPEALFDAVAAAPPLGVLGSTFIYPVMHQVDESGVAAELLSEPVRGVDVHAGGRLLLRAAALSMLQEPPEHAPYGWSHCLTMPQAALGIAGHARDPNVALAVAATYVVGFRAALATRPLARAYAPADPGVQLADALDAGPQVAAAAVWHAPEAVMGGIVTELATRASRHGDAHLVKYT
ncbi:MAG TPA: hypothetical protein VFF40_09010, partial [Acidimicrobiia bacterium]|nr:hypothetical protein [Acidimicrobiia bacterium]